MPAVGDNFLRYKIISLIGTGGMGEVYLAKDTQLDRNVALKILKPKLGRRYGDALDRFILEARSASALNHPNIITIYEIGEYEGSNYIASEYVEGKTLHERINRKSLSLPEILTISIQTAAALAAAHAAGIVHRDIKPENIMIRRDGYIKVLDFGLAKLTEIETEPTDVEADTKRLVATNPGIVMGTVSYMSPEQARGKPVDKRTDIWSLGVVMYEMMTGVRPFTGETNSDVIAAILKSEPEAISTRSSGTPHEFERIIGKALRKDRDERYQNVKDMLIDLNDLKRELDVQMRSETATFAATDGQNQAVATGNGNLTVESTAEAGVHRTNSISEMFISQFRLHPIYVTLGLLAAIAAVILVGLLIKGSRTNSTPAFNSMRFTKLTTTGRASEGLVAISSDGKYVAYVARDRGQAGLWVRQSTAPGAIQAVAPGNLEFTGLTFTHDGRFVYFTAADEKGQSGVYRVSTLGGDNKKIVSDVYGPVTFTQDDSQFAFIRNARELLIANSDGNGIRSITVGEPGEALHAPAWSPDGTEIVLRSFSAADDLMRLFAVSPGDGSRHQLGSTAWPMISSISWLADGSGLLLSGRDPETRNSQLWIVNYPTGELTRVTNELSSYVGASTAADGRTAVSVQVNRTSKFWTADIGDPKDLKPLSLELAKEAALSGMSLAPDGRIVYTTRVIADYDIWIADLTNGSNKQLTSDAGSNFNPNVTSDGRSIVFVSSRTGSIELWKMNIDGTEPIQLTNTPGIEGYPTVTPDSKWVVYQIADDARRLSVWKIPVEGGQPTQLVSESSSRPQISPDGKYVACKYGQSSSTGNGKIAVIPLDGGPPVQVLDFPDIAGSPLFKWSIDGRSLLYIDSKNGGHGLWSQSLDGGQPKLVTDPGDQRIWSFDRSSINKQFVFALGEETSDVVLIGNFR